MAAIMMAVIMMYFLGALSLLAWHRGGVIKVAGLSFKTFFGAAGGAMFATAIGLVAAGAPDDIVGTASGVAAALGLGGAVLGIDALRPRGAWFYLLAGCLICLALMWSFMVLTFVDPLQALNEQ